MNKQWGGRFDGEPDALMEALGASVGFDARLAPWDIRASIAHARMLGAASIIASEDATRIIEGLESIARDIDAGAFDFDPALEDVHTNIEAALVQRIGDAGKRLHTGRSRNDQVATDTRLWARDQLDSVVSKLRALQLAIVDFADAHIEVILPGCTHLQHAQPVLLAHHLLAYYEMFERDRERFRQLRPRVNVLPLGSAALAGTPHVLDRRAVAEELGFEAVSRNSMDAVSDRDFLIEFCADASLVMMHLSRLCEELVLWSTPEYRYIELGDAFTTGSSIMPQKRNPDAAELIRAKCGRVFGSLITLLTVLKGLPLTYNRDLQEDKEPVFDTSDTLQLALAAITKLLPTVRVNAARMMDSAREGFPEATDLADYLVAKGMPFRQAHEVTGRIVKYCEQNRRRLPALTVDELQRFSSLFDEAALSLLDLETLVGRRDNLGGTSPRRVREALAAARRELQNEEGP